MTVQPYNSGHISPNTSNINQSTNKTSIISPSFKDVLNVLKIPENKISMIIKEEGTHSTNFRNLPDSFAVELAAQSALAAIVTDDDRKKLEKHKNKVHVSKEKLQELKALFPSLEINEDTIFLRGEEGSITVVNKGLEELS